MKTQANQHSHSRPAAEPEETQQDTSGSFLSPPPLQFGPSDPPVQRKDEEVPEETQESPESTTESSPEETLSAYLHAVFEQKKVDYQPIQDKVLLATEAEKEAAWRDGKLMKKAYKALHQDDYLILLTDLHMAKTGSVTRISPADTDAAIQAHLGPLIADAIKEGRQLEGSIAVVDSLDWNRAGKAHYGEEWKDKQYSILGFVDSMGKAWIHKDKGDSGVMIHEAIHIYSRGTFDTYHNLSEGITEYFTRKVCAQLGPTISPRKNYQDEYNCVSTLQKLVSEPVLASAYFDGKKGDLSSAFIAAKSKSDWSAFLSAMKAGDWPAANRLCLP